MSGVLHGIVASLKAAAAAATDSYFKYVTLLLHGDGTNGAQNNTFLDGSTNNFTITRNGNTTQGTFSPFSQTGWSNFFDGTGDYLTVPDSTAFTFGSGDFTVEAWVWYTTTGGRLFICGQSNSSGTVSTISIYLEKSAANKLRGVVASSSTEYAATSTADLPLNQWVHVAFVRNGNTGTLYINGTSDGTVSLTGITANDSTNLMGVGSCGELTTLTWNGYISNLRIVKGTAVYTAAFTPPTAPLTAITNTSLLTCQSNRFIDNSSNGFAITRNGDVRVEAFSPFNPSTTYSTANVGGSGYFDGTGDELSAGSNAAFAFGTGAYTVEFWVYKTATASSGECYLFMDSAGGFGIYEPASNLQLTTRGGGFSLTSSTSVPLNQWNHIAVVRSGTGTNQTSIFLNGTRIANGTDSTNWTVQGPCKIGGISLANFYVYGYMSNVRVVKGTAVYDPTLTALTVPTAPLTAITNTSLLLNYTNGGIFDNASQTVLETVGNAQVSTAQFKYGTGSMLFDGTGDWLTAPDRPPLRFGTGPFTIEMWVYRSASGTYGLVAKGTGTTGWLVSLNASNQVVFTFTTSTITSTGTVAATTWTHIAVVREGTGTNQTKIYINGTNDGTGTVSTDFNQTNILYIGADRTGGSNYNGYIDDLRITNGYARYTANFTSPTAAFPDN